MPAESDFKRVILRVDVPLWERATSYAKRHGLPLASLFRFALINFLDREESKSGSQSRDVR